MITIRRATIQDIEAIAALFNAYRVFYEQVSDIDKARAFLEARLTQNQSVIFLAEKTGRAVGFTQLYPIFSSVSMQEMYLLNDLYVDVNERKQGIGEQLLVAAQELVRVNGFKGLSLETASDNPAQKLYERLGWQKDDEFYHYFWKSA
jgi:ribosomal protein S18 acetylase RimI-like enzyme